VYDFRHNFDLDLRAGNYTRLICQIFFSRNKGHYIIFIYIPSCLIVVISWVSFWLHVEASPARVALGITSVLTMTTLISSTNAALPKISYLKSVDVYLVTCYFYVFLTLIEFASVNFLTGRLKAQQQQQQQQQQPLVTSAVSCLPPPPPPPLTNNTNIVVASSSPRVAVSVLL
jgi:gamma-aminobutyric acid receptor subunit beta